MLSYTATSLGKSEGIAISRAHELARDRGYTNAIVRTDAIYYSGKPFSKNLRIIITEELSSRDQIAKTLEEDEDAILFAIHTDQQKPYKKGAERVFRMAELTKGVTKEVRIIEGVEEGIKPRLPKMLSSDLVSKWYGLKEGMVVEVEGTIREIKNEL